jgi:hypothetical protein
MPVRFMWLITEEILMKFGMNVILLEVNPLTLQLVITPWWTHESSEPLQILAYRFGHQKAVLTNVLLKMGIIMLETC